MKQRRAKNLEPYVHTKHNLLYKNLSCYTITRIIMQYRVLLDEWEVVFI